MDFAQRLLILRLGLISAVGLVAFFATRGTEPSYVVIAIAFSVAVVAHNVIAERMLDLAWGRLNFFRERSMYAEWDLAMKDLETYTPMNAERRISMKTEKGLWELHRGDKAKARQLLESAVAESPEHSPFRVLRQNNVAWALVSMGEFETAERMSRDALDRARAQKDERMMTFCSGTLGAALVGVGKHEEAIGHLKFALEKGADVPRAQAIRYFYLGEAYTALGRDADARNAYREGADVDRESEYGKKCDERLDRPQGRISGLSS